MATAVRVRQTGGPEVLEVGDVEIDDPGPREILVDVAAAGVNFIDTYQRSGIYPMELPYTPGLEGAGTVAAVGSEVGEFAVGDRVAWQGTPGGYAQQALVPADMAFAVPDGVSDEVAAALLLQGMTAHYLLNSTYPVGEGETVLVHAAAGGVGLLLVQLAKAKGAKVIGTVSTPEKERLAREAGADEVIRYDERDFVAATREFTDGEGVPVVYDGVGKSTYEGSLSCLRPRGLLALFGASSGPVPPIDPQRLNAGGSLYLTRPKIADYTRTREESSRRASELLEAVRAGTLTVRIGQRYPLRRAREAHEDLEGRRTTGKVLLSP
ncbi:Zn-dependent oxidoreductase, NADPH:quinone reductase [Saccharomonospora marina XMU15]|uniref:Zn-dependent oxidoreductase, NADPH:quinone reductase n=1 Tax=Saccharomonospora marina XMU15 TaxID=882083 RepID=H5X9R5_9PSEU|nr:quinone oxidoreductase [Saccharomonospora marina]EHR51505.1 Zn-dependent oxidoreductase, NADPH:quinone reductase [Saccharomonospora marina XMU15]